MNNQVQITSDVQTLIWDLDGTLLDSFGMYRDSLNAALREQGRPEAPEAILRSHHHGTIEESITGVLADMGQTFTNDEFADIMQIFFAVDNAFMEHVDQHLFEDAVDLMERAHRAGKRQVIVTNRPHGIDRQNGSPRNMVDNSRLHELVDYVLCGDDCEHRKPTRQVLEARFGSDLALLGEILVIGDQFVDGQFAHNLDCSAILVARNGGIAHLERLGDWQHDLNIVSDLRTVHVETLNTALPL